MEIKVIAGGVICLFVYGFIFIGDSEYPTSCENLQIIAKDKTLKEKMNALIDSMKNNSTMFEVTDKKDGIVFDYKYPGKLDINWAELNILKELGTVELKGENINYQDLTSSEIDSISIGYGYRTFLVMRLNKDIDLYNQAHNIPPMHKRLISEDILLVCKNQNLKKEG